MSAHEQNVALPMRSQTLLGVCEAIGEDFGFNANYIRVPLGAIVVFNIWGAIAVYLGLGLVVLASRMLFPKGDAPRNADAQVVPAHANSEVEARIAA